jgi:uncharacterized protein (DUF885 family)
MRQSPLFLCVLICLMCFKTEAQSSELDALSKDFLEGYQALAIPETELDYKANFQNIPNSEQLTSQQNFFFNFSRRIDSINKTFPDAEDMFRLKQLRYETDLNLERILLEKKWNDDGRTIPAGGLHSLPNFKEWYRFYIKLFTSVNISPEDVHAFGKSEVQKIRRQVDSIRKKSKLEEKDFYTLLRRDSFFLTDKNVILSSYADIDKTVRKNLGKLFTSFEIPPIGIMEWPGAGPSTPPGMYLDKGRNAYGKDVFQYNFYGAKHNRRCMDWLYMHEGIPGHHFQSIFKNSLNKGPLQNQFFYFGNAEGWACYIEDLGKELGLYQNDFTFLGKLEWDLVRSARLVMETGIHYYGWTREEAMAYWKENIKGQDEIADREITRITNWAGQALCYKVGAMAIKKIVASKKNIKEAHQFILLHSDFPLEVLL